MDPPLCTNGSAKYLMHLSVKLSEASKSMFAVRNGGHFVFMQIWLKKNSREMTFIYSAYQNMFEKLILRY